MSVAAAAPDGRRARKETHVRFAESDSPPVSESTVTSGASTVPSSPPDSPVASHRGSLAKRRRHEQSTGAFVIAHRDRQYQFTKRLSGGGGHATVYLATELESKRVYAVKRFEIASCGRTAAELVREVEILKSLQHECSAALDSVFRSATHFYMVLEYVAAEELYDRVTRQLDLNQTVHRKGALDERTARALFLQLLAAVKHCHRKGVAHRDIKLDNILVGRDDKLKLVGFGLAERVDPTRPTLYTFAGTRNYMAPEALEMESELRRESLAALRASAAGKQPPARAPRVSYDAFAADVWSCAVTLFAMVAGRLPFDGGDPIATRSRVLDATFKMPEYASPALIDLFARVFVADPTRRLPLEAVLAHPWCSPDGSAPLMETPTLAASVPSAQPTQDRKVLTGCSTREDAGGGVGRTTPILA